MKLVTPIGAPLAAVVVLCEATAGASPPTPATYGPPRVWGGTEIRSLDPAPPAGAASVVAADCAADLVHSGPLLRALPVAAHALGRARPRVGEAADPRASQ